MRLIIAGGRYFQGQREHWDMLDNIPNVTVVVSGGASGADSFGEEWARRRGKDIACFEADWNKYGKKAGPIRNGEMAEYADAVVLFPGGKGTKSMFNEAKRAGLKIYDWRNKK